MPMTEPERARVLSEIGAILRDDVHEELMNFFAAAVALNEKHPEQVNNEIRNAFTHFARALAADSCDDAEEELRKGRSHIERAKRDTLKLAVIAIRDRIKNLCGEIKLLNGRLAPAFVVRRDELTARRRQLLRKEISGEKSFLTDFIRLFNDADQLELELLGEFNMVESNSSPFKRYLIHARRQAVGLAFGVIVGVLGSFAYDLLSRDEQATAETAANTSSTDATQTPPAQPR